MEEIVDTGLLDEYEHFIQLSFFTGDLHVSGAWKCCKPEEESELMSVAETHKSQLTRCLLETCQIPHFPDISTLTQFDGKIAYNATELTFPLGQLDPPVNYASAPTSTYYFAVFNVVLGNTFESLTPFNGDDTVIPYGYASVCHLRNSNEADGNFYRMDVRLSHPRQALLVGIVRVEFKPVRVEVFLPVCEVCQAQDATKYCPADEAHLCSECDSSQHSVDKFLASHIRVPVLESPAMFGACSSHPSENVSRVCLTCWTLVCSHCLLISGHADDTFADHQLAAVTAVYSEAMASIQKRTAEVDREDDLKSQLMECAARTETLLARAENVKERLDGLGEEALKQFDALRNAKTRVCGAVERQLLGMARMAEWTEQFLEHVRMAMKPVDFLFLRQRHRATVEWLFSHHTCTVARNLFSSLGPHVFAPIRCESSLQIAQASAARTTFLRLEAVSTEKLSDSTSPNESHATKRLFFVPVSDTAAIKKEEPLLEPLWTEDEENDVGAFGAVSATSLPPGGLDGKAADVDDCAEDDFAKPAAACSEEFYELWELLMQNNWQALRLLIQGVPSSTLHEVVNWLLQMSILAGHFDNCVQAMLKAEAELWMQDHSEIPISLRQSIAYCVFVAPDILLPTDFAYLDAKLAPLTEPYDDNEKCLESVISGLTRDSTVEVPNNIRLLAHYVAREAGVQENLALHRLREREWQEAALQSSTRSAKTMLEVCAASAMLLRCALDGRLSYLQSRSSINEHPRARSLSSALREVAAEVWRVAHTQRLVSICATPALYDIASVTRIQRLSLRVFEWCRDVVLAHPAVPPMVSDVSLQPIAGLTAANAFCEYIGALDGALWEGHFPQGWPRITQTEDTAEKEHMEQQTRLFDKLVLHAMAWRHNLRYRCPRPRTNVLG